MTCDVPGCDKPGTQAMIDTSRITGITRFCDQHAVELSTPVELAPPRTCWCGYCASFDDIEHDCDEAEEWRRRHGQ